MKEEFNSKGWKDFAQRYCETYGWYETETKKRLLVQLTTVNYEQLSFTAKDGMKYYAKSDQGNVFEFIPVTRGVYQYGKDVVHVMRRPMRQWKRGICEGNTNIISLTTQRTIPVGFDVLETIFGNKNWDVLEKFKKDASLHSVCLDGIFSVVANRFYLYNNCIGNFDREKMDVTLTHPLFKQETEDLFRKLNMDVHVE